jgi:hypothetical protein
MRNTGGVRSWELLLQCVGTVPGTMQRVSREKDRLLSVCNVTLKLCIWVMCMIQLTVINADARNPEPMSPIVNERTEDDLGHYNA